jgi:ParB-like nuclease family protein
MPKYTNLTNLSKYPSNQWIPITKMEVVKFVDLEDLTLELQQRVPEADSTRDQAIFEREQKAHIQKMIGSLKRDEALDPITCVYVDGILHVVDGYHRITAAAEYGCSQIMARVVAGTFKIAKRLSYEYNHKSPQLAISKAQRMEQIWRMVRESYDPERETWTEEGPAEICRTFGMNPRSKTTINNMRDKVKELGKDSALNTSWREAKDTMTPYELSEEKQAEKELQIAEDIFNQLGDPVRLASVSHALQQMAAGREVTTESLLQVRDMLLQDLTHCPIDF